MSTTEIIREARRACGIAAPFDFLAPPSWRAIAKLSALKHGVRASDLAGTRRWPPIVAARHEAMQLIYRHCGLSSPQIARHFGGRDHTTVLYAIRKIEGRLKVGARHAH